MSCLPTETLMSEHRIIEKVLSAMRGLADAVTSGKAVERDKLEGLVPFMREFADAYHHAKEEHRLFPRLVERGLPSRNGPVQAMCAEHQTGRDLVGQLEVAINRYLGKPDPADADLPDALNAIVDYYTRHIWKEDNILFPMADRVLNEDDQTDLAAAFDEVNLAGDSGARQRFINFAEHLA